MAETDQLLAAVLETPERVHAAMQIVIARNEIRSGLLATLRRQRKERLREIPESASWTLEDWKLDRCYERHTSFSNRFGRLPLDARFRLGFDQTECTSLHYGMTWVREDSAGQGALRAAIVPAMGEGEIPTTSWPWWR